MPYHCILAQEYYNSSAGKINKANTFGLNLYNTCLHRYFNNVYNLLNDEQIKLLNDTKQLVQKKFIGYDMVIYRLRHEHLYNIL